MSAYSTSTPGQKARAAFMGQAERLSRQILLRAESVAENLSAASPSHVRGLINAFGSGPGRRTPAARRASLATFLAWRAHRDAEAAWVEAVRTAIVELEQQCEAAVRRVRRSQTGYWDAHADALTDGGAWLRMEVLETFLHALERRTIAQQDASSCSSTAD